MILYLSSQKFGNNVNFLKDWIENHNKKILLIFNALDAKGEDNIINNVKDDINLLEKIGFEVKTIDLKKYFGKENQLRKDFLNCNAFCVMGGNVFVLRQSMKHSGFDMFLKEISNDDNYLYIGYSAGSCVLSKRLDIFKNVDEPINYYNKDEIIYDGINLIDYVFIPHYKSNYHKAYLIDELVDKCKKENIKYKTFSDGDVTIENVIGSDN